MVVGMCDRFGKLPVEGGVLDQPAEFMRMLEMVKMATPIRRGSAERSQYQDNG